MDDKRDGSDDKRVDVFDKEKDDDYSNIDSDRNNDKDLSIIADSKDKHSSSNDKSDRVKGSKVDGESTPSVVNALSTSSGYNQTYIIMTGETRESKNEDGHEVFFRCGNWCYKGRVQFNGLRISVSDLPLLIPVLQRQQGSLRYYCNASSIPSSSGFSEPLTFLNDVSSFVSGEMLSENIDRELRKMATVFPWIDEDDSKTYFELTLSNMPSFMNNVGLVATKTYTRGLIILSIYFDSTVYFIIQSGEGDQALLDVRFPDVSSHGQGLHLATYNDPNVSWKKLTLWHMIPTTVPVVRELPKLRTISASSKNYEQTYCIMKSSWDSGSPLLSIHHDVLFRFGSWCYAGRVQLTPSLALADVPFIIPALRMQQSRLDFVYEVNNIPTTSPFAGVLGYISKIGPLLEQQIVASEGYLRDLIDRLTKMGLGESVSRWLEGDSSNSFFEFKIQPDSETASALNNMELVATKIYHASGIITITILFQNSIYVSVLDGSNENPLLDSRFPDISAKGRGYQIQAYEDGIPEWPGLRKISIWQTVNALEQEFREKAAQLAQAKAKAELALSEDLGKQVQEDEQHIKKISSPETEVPVADEKSTYSDFESTTSAEKATEKSEGRSDIVDVGSRDEVKSVSKTTDIGSSNESIGSNDNSIGKSNTNNVIEQTSSSLSGLGGISGKIARPHHLPSLKNDSLSQKMDRLRAEMTEEGTIDAPWDAQGRPINKLSFRSNSQTKK